MLAFDIQLEIIKSFPVKSLIRFRSVCKAWKSFIDSSEFIAGYNVGHDQPQQHLMIRYKVGDWGTPEVKFVGFVDEDTFPQQKLTVPPILQLLNLSRIIDSSCGLLGIYGYFREPGSSTTKFMVVLWNPTIRKSIAVDVPNVKVHGPFNSVIGFGVCPHTKDPKLVKIESISYICQVMVFTLSSGKWTCLSSNQLPRKSIQFTWSQAVIGQFIYWLACESIAVGYVTRNLIMSFDLSTHEFREVQLPDSLADVPRSDLSISKLRESLVVLVYNRNIIDNQVYDVWMMDPKAFTNLFTINAPEASVPRILAFRKNGKPILEMRNDHKYFKTHRALVVYDRNDFEKPCALVVYEPCSQHFMDLGVRGNWFSFSGRSYTESLLLLDHNDGHIVRYGAVKR